MADKKVKTAMVAISMHVAEIQGITPGVPQATYQIKYRRGHSINGETSLVPSDAAGTVRWDERIDMDPCVLPQGAQTDPKCKKYVELTLTEKLLGKEPRPIGRVNVEVYFDNGKKKKAQLAIVREDTKQRCMLSIQLQVAEQHADDMTMDSKSSLSKKSGNHEMLSQSSFGTSLQMSTVQQQQQAAPPPAVKIQQTSLPVTSKSLQEAAPPQQQQAPPPLIPKLSLGQAQSNDFRSSAVKASTPTMAKLQQQQVQVNNVAAMQQQFPAASVPPLVPAAGGRA